MLVVNALHHNVAGQPTTQSSEIEIQRNGAVVHGGPQTHPSSHLEKNVPFGSSTGRAVAWCNRS